MKPEYFLKNSDLDGALTLDEIDACNFFREKTREDVTNKAKVNIRLFLHHAAVVPDSALKKILDDGAIGSLILEADIDDGITVLVNAKKNGAGSIGPQVRKMGEVALAAAKEKLVNETLDKKSEAHRAVRRLERALK